MSKRTSFRFTAPPAGGPRPAARGAAPPGCPAARTPAPRRRTATSSAPACPPSPAKATWVMPVAGLAAEEEQVAGPDVVERDRSRRTRACCDESRGSVTPRASEGGLHQPRAVHAPRGHPAPLVRRAREVLERPALGRPGARGRARPRPRGRRRPRPAGRGGRRAGGPPSPLERHPGAERQPDAGSSPSRTTAPRLQPVASRAPGIGRRVVDLDAVAGVDPALVAVEVGADAAPVAGATSSTAAVSPSTSWLTCSARRVGCGEERDDGGAGDDGAAHDGRRLPWRRTRGRASRRGRCR